MKRRFKPARQTFKCKEQSYTNFNSVHPGTLALLHVLIFLKSIISQEYRVFGRPRRGGGGGTPCVCAPRSGHGHDLLRAADKRVEESWLSEYLENSSPFIGRSSVARGRSLLPNNTRLRDCRYAQDSARTRKLGRKPRFDSSSSLLDLGDPIGLPSSTNREISSSSSSSSLSSPSSALHLLPFPPILRS